MVGGKRPVMSSRCKVRADCARAAGERFWLEQSHRHQRTQHTTRAHNRAALSGRLAPISRYSSVHTRIVVSNDPVTNKAPLGSSVTAITSRS